jgi:hypothetical protein
MTASKSGRFGVEAGFQQPPPTSVSTINLSCRSLSAASFIASKRFALARTQNPH